MSDARILAELKRDGLGVVELLERRGDRYVRRVARGGRVPGSGWLARVLLRREGRAMDALEGLAQVPGRVSDEDLASLPSLDGHVPRRREVLLRTYLDGAPLHRAELLPRDWFDLLDELVQALHERGVCHNDLHKEQNLLVRPDGAPALIDFQLASVHRGRGWLFRSRVHDDLRHVQKHRRRYTRDGRGPESEARGVGHGLARTRTSAAWKRWGKPVYLWITRGLLGTRDGEERRPSSGPWPKWGPPLRGGGRGPGPGFPYAERDPIVPRR